MRKRYIFSSEQVGAILIEHIKEVYKLPMEGNIYSTNNWNIQRNPEDNTIEIILYDERPKNSEKGVEGGDAAKR